MSNSYILNELLKFNIRIVVGRKLIVKPIQIRELLKKIKCKTVIYLKNSKNISSPSFVINRHFTIPVTK